MKIKIIARENDQSKIMRYIENNALMYAVDPASIAFVDDAALCDRLVFDEYSAIAAKPAVREHHLQDRSYVWIYDTAIPIRDCRLLDAIQRRCFEAEDWDNVKRINRLKIEIGYLLEETTLRSYPVQLQMESTSFCNARCIMCSHYYAGNAGALDMSDEMLEKLERILPYIEILIMHGNGEPFLSRNLKKSVDLYRKYKVKLTTNTNLSILTDEMTEMINDAFVNIRVSCDGCTKEIYEGIRRGLSFETLTANLEKLQARCPTVTKTMASIIMRQNVEQLPDLVRFARRYGFEEIIFSNLGTSLLVGNEKDAAGHYPHLTARMLREAVAVGERIGITVTIPSSYDLNMDDARAAEQERQEIHASPFFATDEEISRIREFAKSVVGSEYRIIEDLKDCYWEENLYSCSGICEWCTEKLFVDLKGNVYVCCINATYRVGNLFEADSFESIWNNDVYVKIRSLFYQGKFPGFCDNCQFVLNGSLKNIGPMATEEGFRTRRHISRFYRDYSEGHRDG